jgi:hypothetical protein
MDRSERSDALAVQAQLGDVVRSIARVSRCRQQHPYGSTAAVETIADVELAGDRVSIPIETDSLPVRAVVRVVQHGVVFRVEGTLHDVNRGRATYEVNLVRPVA